MEKLLAELEWLKCEILCDMTPQTASVCFTHSTAIDQTISTVKHYLKGKTIVDDKDLLTVEEEEEIWVPSFYSEARKKLKKLTKK